MGSPRCNKISPECQIYVLGWAGLIKKKFFLQQKAIFYNAQRLNSGSWFILKSCYTHPYLLRVRMPDLL